MVNGYVKSVEEMTSQFRKLISRVDLISVVLLLYLLSASTLRKTADFPIGWAAPGFIHIRHPTQPGPIRSLEGHLIILKKKDNDNNKVKTMIRFCCFF